MPIPTKPMTDLDWANQFLKLDGSVIAHELAYSDQRVMQIFQACRNVHTALKIFFKEWGVLEYQVSVCSLDEPLASYANDIMNIRQDSYAATPLEAHKAIQTYMQKLLTTEEYIVEACESQEIKRILKPLFQEYREAFNKLAEMASDIEPCPDFDIPVEPEPSDDVQQAAPAVQESQDAMTVMKNCFMELGKYIADKSVPFDAKKLWSQHNSLGAVAFTRTLGNAVNAIQIEQDPIFDILKDNFFDAMKAVLVQAMSVQPVKVVRPAYDPTLEPLVDKVIGIFNGMSQLVRAIGLEKIPVSYYPLPKAATYSKRLRAWFNKNRRVLEEFSYGVFVEQVKKLNGIIAEIENTEAKLIAAENHTEQPDDEDEELQLALALSMSLQEDEGLRESASTSETEVALVKAQDPAAGGGTQKQQAEFEKQQQDWQKQITKIFDRIKQLVQDPCEFEVKQQWIQQQLKALQQLQSAQIKHFFSRSHDSFDTEDQVALRKMLTIADEKAHTQPGVHSRARLHVRNSLRLDAMLRRDVQMENMFAHAQTRQSIVR